MVSTSAVNSLRPRSITTTSETFTSIRCWDVANLGDVDGKSVCLNSPQSITQAPVLRVFRIALIAGKLYRTEDVMPELTRLLTDDHGVITHLVTEEEDRVSVEELAEKLAEGVDYYVTFGDEEKYGITIVAEDGHLEPTVDDPQGVRSIWDLPQEEDPEESEINEMFDELTRMGEFDDEGLSQHGPVEENL